VSRIGDIQIEPFLTANQTTIYKEEGKEASFDLFFTFFLSVSFD